MSQNKYDGIDIGIIKAVRYHTKKLKLSGFNSVDIEDIEQELMLAVFSKLEKFDPQKAKLGTFVGKILKNCTSNLMRNSKTLKSGANVFHMDLDRCEVAISSESIIKSADINSYASQVLSPELKIIFELVKSNTIKDIARILNKSDGYIYGKLSQIRIKMNEFKDYEKEI